MTDLYFMRNTVVGYIKIGVSLNVAKRLRAVEAACGMPLELLRVIAGAGVNEPYLHQIFADARLKGEWFSPVPALLTLATTDAPLDEFVRESYAEMVERFCTDETEGARRRFEATYGTQMETDAEESDAA